MEIKNDFSMNELHERNYSLYETKSKELAALKELHDRSYMILDEKDTLNLLIEYEDEFDRLSSTISFVSLRKKLQTEPLYNVESHSSEKTNHSALLNDLVAILDSIVLYKSTIKKHSESVILEDHYFYIGGNETEFGRCEVIGSYDVRSGMFLLKEGSIFPLDVSSRYRYSVEDMRRRMFLSKNCRKKTDGYYLLKDFACLSPAQAAMYVFGCMLNGLTIWKDENGLTLKDYYDISE